MQPLRYSSHVGAPIECAMSTVRFLNEKALSSDQLLPTTDGPAIKGKKVEVPSPKTIDAYAEAHEKPFVRLYVTNGEDYKSIKPRVQNWLSSLGEHDEWLIVHLGGKEAGGFFSRSVASILRSDFSKSKLERYVSTHKRNVFLMVSKGQRQKRGKEEVEMKRKREREKKKRRKKKKKEKKPPPTFFSYFQTFSVTFKLFSLTFKLFLKKLTSSWLKTELFQ